MQNLGKITKYLPFFALENVKRHVPVVRPNAFSCPGNARKWRRIYAFRPELEGNARKDGQSGSRKRRWKEPTVRTSGSHLPRLPTDRQVAHLTWGRLIVDYLGQTVGSLSCYITWEMVRHRTATHDCRVRLSYLCRVIESVQKIIFPVGENFFSNWRNSSLIKGWLIRKFCVYLPYLSSCALLADLYGRVQVGRLAVAGVEWARYRMIVKASLTLCRLVDWDLRNFEWKSMAK